MLLAWVHGWGGGPWFLFFPLFWLAAIVFVAFLFRRGRWGSRWRIRPSRSSANATPEARSPKTSTGPTERSSGSGSSVGRRRGDQVRIALSREVLIGLTGPGEVLLGRGLVAPELRHTAQRPPGPARELELSELLGYPRRRAGDRSRPRRDGPARAG